MLSVQSTCRPKDSAHARASSIEVTLQSGERTESSCSTSQVPIPLDSDDVENMRCRENLLKLVLFLHTARTPSTGCCDDPAQIHIGLHVHACTHLRHDADTDLLSLKRHGSKQTLLFLCAAQVVQVVGESVFLDDDAATAVTEGIDFAAIPHECGDGHLVVFDCEGGNNAMSKSHSIVTVVGALLATVLAFVTDGKASEAAIEALSLMLQESRGRCSIECATNTRTMFGIKRERRTVILG